MSRPVAILSSTLLRQSLILSLFRCCNRNLKSVSVKKIFVTSLNHLSSNASSSTVDFHNVRKQSCSRRRRYLSSQSSGDDKDPTKEDETMKISNSSLSEYNPKEDSFFTQDDAYGSKVNKGLGDEERPFYDPLLEVSALPKEEEEEGLSPPTNCCRSGCPNCVWIDYVEKLSKKYSDPLLSREKVLKDLDGMQDQSIKAFLMMELKSKGLI